MSDSDADLPAIEIRFGDNLDVLRELSAQSFQLIYIDPPFNTGKVQSRVSLKTVRDEDGDRTGFQGKRYRSVRLGSKAYADVFDDYLEFLVPRLEEAHRLLTPTGSLFLHLDYREVHYAKVALDGIFGRASFINEIIWAYDYGARSTTRWPAKHDNILWYAKDPESYTFELDAVDRIPYMAPGLVGPEKAARGKTPTDTWWHTIVSPNGKEKTGYPTQKPLGIIERIVKVHSRPGDRLLDFFAGSGTLGEAAARNGRRAVLIDNNEQAIEVMAARLAFADPAIPGYELKAVPTASRSQIPLFGR
jgi:site-specific DNA-methyltransferase (adenine-specific)